MTTLLVTGGTGSLGQPAVDRLRAAGHTVRVLSRRTGPGLLTGDLNTGAGLAAAVDGVDLIVHLATGLGRRDVQQTSNLLDATPRSTPVLYTSIMGVDRIPLPYYRYKLEAEHLVESHPTHTILRATQFYTLLDQIFSLKLPAFFAPAVPIQPIAVEDVAARLVELVANPVSGRAPDIAGPEVASVPDLARTWRRIRASRRPVVPLHLPGKTFRAYASGAALVPGPPYGTITFANHLTTNA